MPWGLSIQFKQSIKYINSVFLCILLVHMSEFLEPMAGLDLHEEPEDLTTQTVMLNKYCFWYHKRHQKIGVSTSSDTMIQLYLCGINLALFLCLRLPLTKKASRRSHRSRR